MKRMVMCVAAALFVLCLAYAAAEGADQDKTVVYSRIYDYAVATGADKVNMRIGPDPRYDWVGAAKEGDWVGILGEQDNWYYAYIPAFNQYGYMSKNYMTMNGETGVPAEAVIANPQHGAKTALRSFPSFQGIPLKAVEDGTPLQIVSVSGGGWYEAEIDGEKGYLRCETVHLTSAAGAEMAALEAPDGGQILMRNRPYFTGSRIIGRFSSGTQAAVLLTSPAERSFCKVMVNGTVGYVPSWLVQKGDEKTDAYAEMETASVTAQQPEKVNLRAQPAEKARVIGRCSGEELRVIAAGEKWAKVYDPGNNTVGYCRTEFLSLARNPASMIRTVSGDACYLYLRKESVGKQGFTVPDSAEVTVLSPGDVWSEVRFAGTVGYIKSDCLH